MGAGTLAPGSGWEAAASARVVRESRRREDLIETTFSDISSWEPTVAGEVARHLSDRFALAVGAAFANYAPTATTPDPAEIGEAYAEWTAPELGLYATEATAWGATMTLRVQPGETVFVWLRGRYGSVSAGMVDSPQPDTPTGDRDGWGSASG